MGNTEICVTEIPRSAIPAHDMRLDDWVEVDEQVVNTNMLESEDDWGVAEWVDLVNSLAEDANRFFILTWKGQSKPLGAIVMDQRITHLNDFEVFSGTPGGYDETKIGYYRRIIDSAGPLGQEQQILIFVHDQVKPSK